MAIMMLVFVVFEDKLESLIFVLKCLLRLSRTELKNISELKIQCT